jgi:hypothetical protein
MIERKYFSINENTARTAKNVNSFSDYVSGSATAEYKTYVDRVYNVVDRIAEEKPHLLEQATRKAERYSRKLAEYYNDYYRNEASCPSILISGGSNFPVRKKEKQNSRRETLHGTWQYLEEYARKITHLLTMEQPILSSDENAIELLEEKLENLTDMQERMKTANKAIRLKDTEKGNERLRSMGYSDEEIKKLREPDFCGRVGYPDYALTNNNANIKRVKGRLESLKKEKSQKTSENEVADLSGVTVKENVEEMRLQLFFEGKPEPEIRDILKRQAFKWSPRNSCWQRQLTNNARWAAKQAIEQIKKLREEVE